MTAGVSHSMHKILIILVIICTTLSLQAQNSTSNFKLSDYSNKIVYVDFWASWCIPCRKSFPWMNEMQEKYKDKGLIIIAINMDEDKDDAKKFLKKYPSKFKVIYDDGTLAEKYKVKGMPYSILFDKNGEITNTHIGFKLKESKDYEQVFIKNLGVK